MIVNPWLFYLMNVCSSLKVVGVLVMIASAIGSLFFGATYVVVILDDTEEELRPSLKKFFTSMVWSLVISSLVVVLLPSKDTLLMMQAAKLATTDNVELVFEALKSALDYAVELVK